MDARKFVVSLVITISFLCPAPVFASPPEPDAIPPDLRQWEQWVLHNLDDRLCPTDYNNGEQYHCTWPSRLTLDLRDSRGSFHQEWLVFIKTWVPLPGGPESWPDSVKVDGKPAPVTAKEAVPSVFLTPGAHIVEGLFAWKEMPETITVPPQSGLVSLSLNGNPVSSPFLDASGRLWLKARVEAERQEDRIEYRIFRLINDTIPMQVVNLLKINISGRSREINTGNVLLESAVPMRIESPLPARLGAGGDLLIQGRPGRWEVKIVSRFAGPVEKLSPLSTSAEPEIWSFQAHNYLRMVKIEGVSPMDPTQTDAPATWQQFPTYSMKSGSVMMFKEIRRGDPEPAPDQLSLYRMWWLDFDGRGFTIKDTINGALSRQWYLAMNPPSRLGRVTIEGVDQLITEQGEAKKPGVELRKGYLNLEAESRLPARLEEIPAAGWDHDFQSVSGILNLPPGWKLLTAFGVDNVDQTWFERWSLLDLFLVLIISLAIARIWSWKWGMVALFAVGLSYHEPGAPRFVWLNLLAALALLRFLPPGWARTVVNLWRWGSVIVLLVLALPFMVNQVRWGIYPQLEEPSWIGPETALAGRALFSKEAEAPREEARRDEMPAVAEQLPAAPSKPMDSGISRREQKQKIEYERQAVLTQDPHALIQTGPGLPAWRWRTIALSWTGPVAKEQAIRFILLSPSVNLVLSLVRVGLLVLLILLLLPARSWNILYKKAIIGACLIAFALAPDRGSAEETHYPPPELLQQLQERLLEKPDCLPACADSPRMLLTVSRDRVRILLSIHAGVETAVPLPGALKSWTPEQVLLDDQPARGIKKDGAGTLWALVPAGVHMMTLYGATPAGDSFSIPLPLKPHQVETESTGWTVQGVHEDGQVEGSIQLTREKENALEGTDKLETKIPPFFQLERVLSLGLTWQVRYTLTRMTPPDTPVMVAIPLLGNESVTSPGIKVEKGRALIAMAADATEMAWASTLKQASPIILQAPNGVAWTERWILDASPIWHCELSGIAVIHHQNQAGFWMPTWQPWPGERVTITVSRPQAMSGQTLTIEKADLNLTPGKRYTNGDVSFAVRTSKGGEHRVSIPVNATISEVMVDQKGQPIKRDGAAVIIPLRPGFQDVHLVWQQPSAASFFIQGPAVSVGPQAVNADVVFQMPSHRWILWVHGPRLGPAVLFWSYVVIVILVALALGRITWLPLKTWQWILLGLGLTQVHPALSLVIVGWLLALGLRKARPVPGHRFAFNVTQVLLAVWTLAALVCLYVAVQEGLLGIPDMQIAGNGSSDSYLHWTQDRIETTMPQPWVLSLPLFVFRILMLLWALWLAYSLLKWLRWGWHCFTEGGLWKKNVKRKQ